MITPARSAIAAILACCSLALPADWPCWRGPTRNGLTPESSGWDRGAWPLGDPVWTRCVGSGATSPIVIGDRLYTMGWSNNTDTVFCLYAASGKDIWRQQYPCPRYGRHHAGDEGFYHGPSSTPSHDPATGYLFTLSIDGHLNCWNTAKNGAKTWGLNLYDKYGVGRRPNVGGGQRDYGYTTSPLVYGPWVIVEVGDDEGNLMAFDKSTGGRAWVSQCRDHAGHTGGLVPITVEGLPCVAVLTLRRLLVARTDPGHEGETAAKCDWQTHYANGIPTPVVVGDCVLLTSGFNMSKTAKLRITLSGARLLWEKRFHSGVASPVVHNGHAYLCWRQVRCVDWETGDTRWTGGRFGSDSSCLITGDDRLIVFGDKRIALVETADRSPTEYRELSVKTGVGSKYSWPHITLANGRLYAKDSAGNLYCSVGAIPAD